MASVAWSKELLHLVLVTSSRSLWLRATNSGIVIDHWDKERYGKKSWRLWVWSLNSGANEGFFSHKSPLVCFTIQLSHCEICTIKLNNASIDSGRFTTNSASQKKEKFYVDFPIEKQQKNKQRMAKVHWIEPCLLHKRILARFLQHPNFFFSYQALRSRLIKTESAA